MYHWLNIACRYNKSHQGLARFNLLMDLFTQITLRVDQVFNWDILFTITLVDFLQSKKGKEKLVKRLKCMFLRLFYVFIGINSLNLSISPFCVRFCVFVMLFVLVLIDIIYIRYIIYEVVSKKRSYYLLCNFSTVLLRCLLFKGNFRLTESSLKQQSPFVGPSI